MGSSPRSQDSIDALINAYNNGQFVIQSPSEPLCAFGSPSPRRSSPLLAEKFTRDEIREALPFEECKIPWRQAADGGSLGSGSFGQVYLALDEDSGSLLAVKEIELPEMGMGESRKRGLRSLQREVGLLATLKHENIVIYKGVQQSAEKLYILMEYLPGGSIASVLKQFGPFRENVIARYLTQMLSGLEYLHRRAIIHRDIKGANVLLTNDGQVKLSDFGQSKQLEEICMPDMALTGTSFSLPEYAKTYSVEGSFKSLKGTPHWLAPECLTEDVTAGEETKVDIWSVGCVVVEMATGRPPYDEMEFANVMALMYHIVKEGTTPLIPVSLSPECQAICSMCFERDPKKRSSATALLQHSFVRPTAKAIVKGTSVTFLTDAFLE